MGDQEIVHEAEWDNLPKDILQGVFTQLFAANERSPWPLHVAHLQVAALRQVCKHWAEALAETPPEMHLEIETAPSHVLRNWVPLFPVQSLRLATLPDLDRLQLTSDNDQDRPEVPTRIKTDCIISLTRAGAVPQGFDQNIDLRVGALSQLRFLCLVCPEVWRKNIIFNAAPLKSLTQLTHLHASGFKDFLLEDLPVSVIDLSLGYGETYIHDVLSSHSISIPSLPHGLILERFSVDKNGIVGLSFEELWDKCRMVEVTALYVLAGVPVVNTDLVTFFERPYREGAYVPPHILGDWDAVEASNVAADSTADELLLGLASCPMLEKLTFSGKCARSVKLVPGRAGTLSKSLFWLHGVIQHATLFLYGMSGAECLDRLLDMQGMGKIPSGVLEIELEDLRNEFRVYVRNRIVGQKVGEGERMNGNGGEEV